MGVGGRVELHYWFAALASKSPQCSSRDTLNKASIVYVTYGSAFVLTYAHVLLTYVSISSNIALHSQNKYFDSMPSINSGSIGPTPESPGFLLALPC